METIHKQKRKGQVSTSDTQHEIREGNKKGIKGQVSTPDTQHEIRDTPQFILKIPVAPKGVARKGNAFCA